MAKKRRILLGFIMLVALFATSSMLVSCEKNVYPNTINIKEFPQYSNFEWNIIEIMIYWDNDNGGYITKNITDTSIINNIWDILCNEVVFEYIG
ncbi:MAG: hypothetical protein LBF12_07925, partial [Christensenellaceae bacterium]|nr:hypothetical protein [Christensenellaceae bacterium]